MWGNLRKMKGNNVAGNNMIDEEIVGYQPKTIRSPKDVADLGKDPDFIAIMKGLARRWRQPDSFAEDIAQETLRYIHEELVVNGEFTDNALKRAWVVGRNLVRTEHRHQKRLRSVDDDPTAYSLPASKDAQPHSELPNWVSFFFLLTLPQRRLLWPDRYGIRQSDMAEEHGVSNATMSRTKKRLVNAILELTRTDMSGCIIRGWTECVIAGIQPLNDLMAHTPVPYPVSDISAGCSLKAVDKFGGVLINHISAPQGPAIVAMPKLLPFVADRDEVTYTFRQATRAELAARAFDPFHGDFLHALQSTHLIR